MAIINITKEIFEEQILKADQPVLVDFWEIGRAHV